MCKIKICNNEDADDSYAIFEQILVELTFSLKQQQK
jgi:hypothetical protein